MRHAEVVILLLLHFTAFLLADKHYCVACQLAKAGQDGVIIGESAIAMQLQKIITHETHVICGIGTILVTCYLHCLPLGKIRVYFFWSCMQIMDRFFQASLGCLVVALLL